MKRSTEVIIRFDNVSKYFGPFKALDKVSFDINRGEVLGFLGPNGAGKTTSMKLLANLLQSTEGRILFHHDGEMKKLNRQTRDILLSNTGFLIEIPSFYDMTPRKLLTYFAKLKGYPRNNISSRVEEIMAFVGMAGWIDQKVSRFSKGMIQKIGILSAVVHDPDVVILDEPQSGLDPTARKIVRDFILQLKDQGKTVFLSSHLLYEVSEVADRIIIISEGKLVACDTLENLEHRVHNYVIRVELLDYLDDDIESTCKKIQDVITPLTGLKGSSPVIHNKEYKRFEIFFNGNSVNQRLILKKLVENGIAVTEFTVPKTNRLENLYLHLVEGDGHSSGGSVI
ncbi:MAG: ABC transporter ATP-binding protein [Candidatus Hodarchaeales archaeon]|jgi:ABC-2 type transport system ATP-binding protein